MCIFFELRKDKAGKREGWAPPLISSNPTGAMAVRLWEIITNLAYLIMHVAASEWVCAICHCPYLLKHVLRYCDKAAKILLSIKTRDPQNAMARLSVHYHKTKLNLKNPMQS